MRSSEVSVFKVETMATEVALEVTSEVTSEATSVIMALNVLASA
jgi:hypothetical protein